MAETLSSPSRRRRGDDLTVVLFKDHYVPRTLRIPLAWIPRLGVALAAGGMGSLIAILLAAQGWFLAWKAQPQRLRTLEDQIENLRRSNEALETELRALRRGETPPPLLGQQETEGEEEAALLLNDEQEQDTAASAAAQSDSVPEASVSPDRAAAPLVSAASGIEAKASPAPAAAGVPAGGATTTAGIPFLLPNATQGGIPAPASLPFRLTPVQTEFSGGMLNLKFALRYVAENGGNQQGRIVILGRAGDRFATYPEAALSASSYPRASLAQAPLAPERGEFFSVSRYREVLGQLRLPPDARQEFGEVWVLIFSTQGKLLFSQNLRVQPSAQVAPSAAPSPAAARKSPTSRPNTEISR